jgi:hypothetical protein
VDPSIIKVYCIPKAKTLSNTSTDTDKERNGILIAGLLLTGDETSLMLTIFNISFLNLPNDSTFGEPTELAFPI